MEATLDSWNGIVANYLKAENLKQKSGSFVADNVRVVKRMDGAEERSQLEVDTNIDGVEYVFALNYTNSKFVKAKLSAPKELIGKKIMYEKAKVQNPQTKQMVDGITIVDIE